LVFIAFTSQWIAVFDRKRGLNPVIYGYQRVESVNDKFLAWLLFEAASTFFGRTNIQPVRDLLITMNLFEKCQTPKNIKVTEITFPSTGGLLLTC
jgi:hypothetical protein